MQGAANDCHIESVPDELLKGRITPSETPRISDMDSNDESTSSSSSADIDAIADGIIHELDLSQISDVESQPQSADLENEMILPPDEDKASQHLQVAEHEQKSSTVRQNEDHLSPSYVEDLEQDSQKSHRNNGVPDSSLSNNTKKEDTTFILTASENKFISHTQDFDTQDASASHIFGNFNISVQAQLTERVHRVGSSPTTTNDESSILPARKETLPLAISGNIPNQRIAVEEDTKPSVTEDDKMRKHILSQNIQELISGPFNTKDVDVIDEPSSHVISTPEKTSSPTEAAKIVNNNQHPWNINSEAKVEDNTPMNKPNEKLGEANADFPWSEHEEVDQIPSEPVHAEVPQMVVEDQSNPSMEKCKNTSSQFSDTNSFLKPSSPKVGIQAEQIKGHISATSDIEQVAPEVLTNPSQEIPLLEKKSNSKKTRAPVFQLNLNVTEAPIPKTIKIADNKSSNAKSIEISVISDPRKIARIDLSSDDEDEAEHVETFEGLKKEQANIESKSRKPKTKPASSTNLATSTSASKVHVLDEEEDNIHDKLSTSKGNRRKGIAIDLRNSEPPLTPSRTAGKSPGSQHHPVRPTVGPKPLKTTKETHEVVVPEVKSDTKSQSLPQSSPTTRHGKRDAANLEDPITRASVKRQKLHSAKSEDLEYTDSKLATNSEPILSGTNTRNVQRSALVPAVVINSRSTIIAKPICLTDEDDTVSLASTQNNTASKSTASKGKAKQAPLNKPVKRQNSEIQESEPSAKRSKVNSQAKAIGRGRKTAPNPSVENNASQLGSRTSSVARREEPSSVLRPFSNPTAEFPRYPRGDVYISLSGSDISRSYCLHSETLVRLSPWFRRQLKKTVQEPDEELRCTLPLIARFELTIDPETSEPILHRVPFTIASLPRVVVAKTLQFLENHDSQFVPKGDICSYDGINETRSVSTSSKEQRNYKHEVIADSVAQAEENIKERFFDSYDNMFRGLYSLPLPINQRQLEIALQQAETALDLAERYDCSPAIRPHLSVHLFNFQHELYPAIAREPPRWLRLALRLKSAPIYRESLLHIVGNYPKWQEEAVELLQSSCYDVSFLIGSKVEQLEKQRGLIDADLFNSSIFINQKLLRITDINEDTYNTWLVVQCWQDWFARSKVEANKISSKTIDSEMYHLMLQGGDAYLEAQQVYEIIGRLRARELTEAELDEIDEDLATMKNFAQRKVKDLCLNNSMVDVRAEGISYFTCLEISDDELPWPTPPYTNFT